MFSKPLSKLFKNNWPLMVPALATLGAGAGFFWILSRPHDAIRALAGVGAAALFGALSGWRRRTLLPNLIFLALMLAVFVTGAGALILTEGNYRRILVAIATLLAGLCIMLAEEPGMGKTTTAWIRRARRGSLLLITFLLGASAAAVATYLRVPPTAIGFIVFLPAWALVLGDTFFEGRELSARRVLGAVTITVLGVELLVALLALPLTFTAVGAALAVALALLREISERAVEAGVFTIPFLQRVAAIALGASILILGTARWS